MGNCRSSNCISFNGLVLIVVFFMKIKSSLKSIKKRDLNSKLVRRRGRVYVINKTNPKFKARQK